MNTFQSNSIVKIEDARSNALSLREIVVTLYRRKWLILAVALPIVVVGGLALFNQASTFTASTRVLVELTDVDQPVFNQINMRVDYDRELSTLFNIAMSVPVAEGAAMSLADSIPEIQSLDPAFAGVRAVDDIQKFLMGSTEVSVVGESRILEFRVHALHPRLALMGVGAMRDAFVEYQIHGRKNVQAIAYYEEQIAIVRAQVDSLLAERSAILTRSGFSDIREEMRLEAGSRIRAEYELALARSEREATEIEYNGLLKLIDGDPRLFPMGGDESRSASLVYLRNQVSKHEDKLNMLRGTHQESSVPVQQQQALLDDTLDSLRRENISYVESLRIKLEASRSKEQMLQGLVESYETRRQGAPSAQYKVSIIDAETTSLQKLMEGLQGKLGEVRIAHQADERVSSIVSLTQPVLVEFFGGGKTIVYFVMLCVFALALGVFMAFIMNILDHRIASKEEIEQYLELPVFASIPRSK